MAMGTHLVSHDNQIDYRFMLGLVVVIWVYLVFATKSLVERFVPSFPGTYPQWILQSRKHSVKIAMAGILVCGSVGAWRNIDDTFIAPFESKHHYLEARLGEVDRSHHSRIVIVNDLALWPSRPNLGIFSVISDLAHPWVTEANVRLVMAEMDLDVSRIDLEVYSILPASTSHDFILDLRPYALELISRES